MTTVTADMRVRVDFIDFPTGWHLARTTHAVHHPKCSWHERMLCDCNVLAWAWCLRGGSDFATYDFEGRYT